MTKQMLRYEVPIDDQTHEIPDLPVVLFGRAPSQRSPYGYVAALSVWCEVPDGSTPATQLVQVVGTGQELDDTWTRLASAVDDAFVWHLYAIPAPTDGQEPAGADPTA